MAPPLPTELELERQLIERANRGQREALAAIYRNHRDWVYALAYRFTGQRDQALDVVQETFLYFYGKFPGFVLRASIRGFLYPVVKHKSISLARRQRRTVSLDEYRKERGDTWQWFTQPTDPVNPRLERELAKLPAGHREVILLRYRLGFRQEEIAEALAIPVGTVKSRLHNALKSLRSGLDIEAQKEILENS